MIGTSHQSTDRLPKTMPVFLLIFCRFFVGSSPPTSTFPEVGVSTPDSILMVVDLPQPLGPTYPTASPFSMPKLMSLTARRISYFGRNIWPTAASIFSGFFFLLYSFTRCETSICMIFSSLTFLYCCILSVPLSTPEMQGRPRTLPLPEASVPPADRSSQAGPWPDSRPRTPAAAER